MTDVLKRFESIARRAFEYTSASLQEEATGVHPFDERNMHPDIASLTQKLFDDAHYAQATFEAYKYVDKKVAKLAGVSDTGVKLMMRAFNEKFPLVKLNALSSISETDEQEGYKFLFSGSVMAIRNPRGHEPNMKETPTECLDHLSLASMLLRRIEKSPWV
ncbi:MAG: TIGR02391 family protein [Gammaproteobacteria bacterium HGW-Gammaproteobacteria-15]|nr:MAG: TIGR02391 family protein [Gammaproteobacteria bacterium HGW-Gammaproteobacteria-15]